MPWTWVSVSDTLDTPELIGMLNRRMKDVENRSSADLAKTVLTDAARTITVTHIFTPSQTFTGGLTSGANVTVSAGGVTVTGNSTITGTLGGVTTLSCTTVTATNLGGTLSTAAQPNVTSVGTLSDLTIGASGVLNWNGRSEFQSPSDGVLVMYNAARTAFSRLQFGGTTSSFPAIKRSSAALHFRLADDSAYCDVALASVDVGAAVTLSGNTAVNGPSISKSADGVLLVCGTTSGVRINNQDNSAQLWQVTNGGTVKINSLAGAGTRTVVVDANGNLSAP